MRIGYESFSYISYVESYVRSVSYVRFRGRNHHAGYNVRTYVRSDVRNFNRVLMIRKVNEQSSLCT